MGISPGVCSKEYATDIAIRIAAERKVAAEATPEELAEHNCIKAAQPQHATKLTKRVDELIASGWKPDNA